MSAGNPLKLQAPAEAGAYVVRYILNAGDKLVAKTPIQIKAATAQVKAPAEASVAQQIQVFWQGPNGKGDYVCVSKPEARPGSYAHYTYVKIGNPVKLQLPSDPGAYEVRYIQGLGDKLLAKTPIEVKAVSASLQAPASVDVAQKIQVSWQGPAGEGDYVSIAKPDQRPGSYQHYTYVKTGNPLSLQAPSKPGQYEVRYILGLGDRLLAKTPIEVKAVCASLQAPAAANVGVKFKVSWKGPGNEGDYVSIARPDQRDGSYEYYTYVKQGNPLNLQAPAKPGTYEVRYVLGHGDRVLAKATIEIKAVSASLQAPASVDMGTKFKVSWKGPGNEGDYVSIARPDQHSGSYEQYVYVKEGNPVTLQAPGKPGQYELRYILGLEDKLISKTGIQVKAVSASVQAPPEVKAGAEVKISWKGPDNENDYISIARPGQQSGSYEEMAWTKDGNPVTIKAPEKPGDYEARYILGQGDALLGKQAIKVK